MCQIRGSKAQRENSAAFISIFLAINSLNELLQNGDNETRLIEIFVQTTEYKYVFSQLYCDTRIGLYYSMDGACFAYMRKGINQCQGLLSKQEKADYWIQIMGV